MPLLKHNIQHAVLRWSIEKLTSRIVELNNKRNIVSGTHGSTDVTEVIPNSIRVIEKVRQYFPIAFIASESISEIHIILPLVDKQKEKCIYLFEALDREKESLRIYSYGIKDTTLEEVFIKVMEEGIKDDKGNLFANTVHLFLFHDINVNTILKRI